MLKIGDREVSVKEVAVFGILVLVALAAVWSMIGSKPKPIIGHAPAGSAAGLVLMEGGQPGAGPGQFGYPRGIAVDGNGDVYVADSKNHRIQKFRAKDWQLLKSFGSFINLGGSDAKKLQTDGPGKMNEPNGVAVGSDDMVYVIDTWNARVQVFTPKGGFKRAFTSDDGFFGPREIAVDPSGFVYVADTGKHRIVKFGPKGEKIRSWGVKGNKPGEFNEPIGLALDQAGNLYVADRLNFRIQVFNPDGQALRSWAVKGWAPEQIDMEPHIALDKAHSLLYVTDGRGKKVYVYKLDGTLATTLEKDSAGRNLFNVPIGVAVDKDGVVYVTDAASAKILKIKGQF